MTNAESQWLAVQIALAKRAVDLVLADVDAIGKARPDVVVSDWDGHTVAIFVNGGVSTPSISAHDSAEATVEVASYMQDQLDDEAWPLCPSHGYGLHSEVLNGSPVWRCRFGDHTVAEIGSLANIETP